MSHLPLTDPRDPAPAPGQRRPPHLKALTSVRFFAAFYVALFHLVRPFSLWGPFSSFIAAGYTGVSFFFLLSGFILTYTHPDDARPTRTSLKNFYFARFARIYPVYFVVTVASGFLLSQYFAQKIHILAFIADFLMVQTWSIRMVSFFNIPAWSVSMEVFFYAVFPFLVMRLKPRSPRAAVLQFGALWALAMVLPAIALIRFPAAAFYDNGPGDKFTFWVRRFPPAGLPEFLAGITLGWALLRWPPSTRRAWIFLAAGVVGLVPCLFASQKLPNIMLHNGLLLPFFALIILGLSRDTFVSRALSAPWLLLLGEASYSLYLVHFMLGDVLNEHLGWHQDFQHLALKLILSIGLSIGLHLAVERPSRKALLRWRNRRLSAATA